MAPDTRSRASTSTGTMAELEQFSEGLFDWVGARSAVIVGGESNYYTLQD